MHACVCVCVCMRACVCVCVCWCVWVLHLLQVIFVGSLKQSDLCWVFETIYLLFHIHMQKPVIANVCIIMNALKSMPHPTFTFIWHVAIKKYCLAGWLIALRAIWASQCFEHRATLFAIVAKTDLIWCIKVYTALNLTFNAQSITALKQTWG